MGEEQLEKYIQDCVKAGQTPAQISASLQAAGWPADKITEHLSSQSQPTPTLDRFLGPIELLKQSWSVFTSRFWVLLGAQLLPIIFMILITLSVGIFSFFAIRSGNYLIAIPTVILIVILAMIVFSWQNLAVIYILQEAGNKAGIREAYGRTRSKIFAFWWISILSTIIVSGGLLFLIIPGLLVSFYTIFTIQILVGEDHRGMDILLKSREYVRDHILGIIGRFAVLLIFLAMIYISVSIIEFLLPKDNLILSIPIRIFINLLNIPIQLFGLTYFYQIYLNLKQLRGNFAFEPPKSTRTWWTVFAVLGLIPIPLVIIAVIVLVAINPTQQLKKAQQLNLSSYSQSLDQERKSHLNIVRYEIDSYKQKNGNYPTSLNALDPKIMEYLFPNISDLDYQLTENGQNFSICTLLPSNNRECLSSRINTVSPTLPPGIP